MVCMKEELFEANQETIDPKILRSIRKSRLREEILLFLYEIRPQYSYPSEIARNVRSDPSNVLGCLKGMSKRYSEDKSLLELNLIKILEKDGKSYYGVSEKGKKVSKYLKQSYRKS